MKNISKLMVTALALGSTAWMATAQTNDVAPPGGPGMRGHRMPPPFIQVLDANRDGVIDTDEMANAATALKTLDKDGDGKLSSAELFPPRPEGAEGQGRSHPQGPPPGAGFGGGTNCPPAPPIIAALDANSDGVIDADELANAPAALKTLDKNGDGQLTADEFLPPRRGSPGMRGQGHGPRGFGGPPPGDGPPPSQDSPQQE